jgi:hypothetical protein
MREAPIGGWLDATLGDDLGAGPNARSLLVNLTSGQQ